MAIQKKKKLTYADMMNVLNQMAETINTVEGLSNHYGKVLDDYITFQDNKDKFIAHLEEKYKPDKPEKETEDATTKDKKGQSNEKEDKKEDDIKKVLDDTNNKNA